jgi:hypothetical protein
MNFDWVNATNILGVYDQFVNTVKDNKDNYSREDWDEIKLMKHLIAEKIRLKKKDFLLRITEKLLV